MLRRMVLSDWRTVPWLATLKLFFELLDIELIQLERRLNFKIYWALPSQMAMPRNANLFPERSHVVAFLRWAGSQIQHRWSTIAFRPLVVVMTCARCKRPGLRMAGFRKFQQTSCITHKVFIAVEVCTPAMPFHTFAQRHYLSLVPSDSSCVIIVCNLMGSGDLFPVSFSVWAEIQFKFWHWMLTYWATTVYPGPLFTSKHDRSTSFMSRNRLTC